MTQSERRAPQPAGLSAAKLRLLEQRLRGVPEAEEGSSSIPKARRDGPIFASFAQRRLWFLHQLAPSSAAYNMAQVLRLEGPLNARALERSFETILGRHEALRTTFQAEAGEPVQAIAPAGAFTLPLVDLSKYPQAQRADELDRRIRKTAHQPFDLARASLLRAVLFRVEPERHTLLVIMHHIVSDAWSFGVFFKELSAAYRAFSYGRAPELPPLGIQYADYALWQRDYLRGEILEREISYWKAQLAGAPEALELPVDHPRPAVQTWRGDSLERPVPPALVQALKRLSRETGASLFMTLFAAFNALLHRYTRQTDLVVGTPSSGRSRIETERVIGFFVNTLALRTQLSGDLTFRDLVQQTRGTVLDAQGHDELPFDQLVSALRPERSASRMPLFQVMFLMQTPETNRVELEGLNVTLKELPTDTAKCDLTLVVSETPTGLSTLWEFNCDLFETDTIRRLAAHFETMLTGATANPDERLSHFPLLDDAERSRLLETWSQTRTAYPRDRNIAQIFEAQAAARPEAIAVEFQSRSLTYRALNERANQLAHRLRTLGVGPDVPVALCLDRSLELIVALLGILKAGGAYVSLNPADPPKRLASLLADLWPPVLLLHERHRSLFAGASNHTGNGTATASVTPVILSLDAGWETFAREPVGNPSCPATAEHLAYISFTSGSTGRPKGVCVPQRGVVRLVKAANFMEFRAEDVFLQFAPIAFDASTLEIWGALLNGARLVVFPPHLPTLAELGDVIANTGVTTLWLTAGLFHQMVEEQLDRLKGVRQLLAGGDVLSPAHVRKALAALPDCRLINGYGPTENTTFTCCYTIPRGMAADRPIPIGRPIANTEVYILDEQRQPVPIGVPGELYAGGDGLARGYLNRPDLTAEKFVPHPFRSEPGATLYRTGDLARYRPDGNIEFLGRIDSQVKIRGFRIELAEIEAVLVRHPAVGECVVIACEDTPGRKQLVAYVVRAAHQQGDANEWRAFLKEKLPQYMVPAAFVVLERLPLLASGKVNRTALPAPARTGTAGASVAPRTPVEAELAAIWRQVMRLEQVGVHENFFELGGHSILAIQVASRVREVFQIELPLQRLFDSPTIAELALVIDHLQANETPPKVENTVALDRASAAPVPTTSSARRECIDQSTRPPQGGQATKPAIPRRGSNGPAPLSFAQQRLWFLEQLHPHSPLYNIPMVARLRGALEVAALEQSLAAVIARHEVLRTRFVSVDGVPVQEVQAPLPAFHLPVVDLEGTPAEARASILEERLRAEAIRPFDLSGDLLLRAVLFRQGPEEHALFINMHHIASDGWSFGVFFDELGMRYAEVVSGRSAHLPDLPIQFADYAAWRRASVKEAGLDGALSYWKRQLAGAPDLLELPTDRPRPSVQSFRGGQRTRLVTAETVDALQAVSQSEGATLFMTLLAGFTILLQRLTRQEDLLVGAPIAGRNQVETERLIGFFINTLVLRADLTGNPTFRELLQRVRQTTLDAYVHQDVPFEKLVEALRPGRTAAHAPFVQVMFVLQTAPNQGLRLPGLSVEVCEVETGTAKFDLTLSAARHERGLAVELEYNADLFEPTTIERWLGYYQVLLEGIAAHPERRVSDLPMLADADWRRVLLDWNQTEVEYPRDASLARLFERQAAARPDAVAVVDRDQRLTYGALNRRANQLARRLQSLGVKSDLCVGVYLDRSASLIVAFLAILKAGGAYLPLDRSYPADRLAFMLEDSQAPVVITEQHLGKSLPQGVRLVCLDSEAAALARECEDNPAADVEGGNLAYVIYTSGSTGKPKGVCVPQRAVSRLVLNTDYARLEPHDVMAQASNCSFDAATWEIWGPLLNGARLVIVTTETLLSPRDLAAQIKRDHITALFLTTALFNQLAAEMPDFCRPLRHLLFGGEAVEPKWVAAILRNGTPERLVHVYGPTETTTFATWHLVRQVPDEGRTVPIGRPIANTTLYVLDPYRRPTPPGVPGELFIGGDGLARGYLHRPELTAERFIPNPFSQDPESRLYKTGDLVRYLENGEVEFLGRIDQQVKIRGFRVELGEIEAMLARHPGVRQAVVVARADAAGARQLVAYVASALEQAFNPDAAVEFLRRQLPEYMVPAQFVVLPELPLTPNGKIDRRALPEPAAAPAATIEKAEPRDELETTLRQIWEQVLQVRPIGIRDNFFALGGHSLLAVRLVARLEKSLGRKVTVATLFQQANIEQLAAVLRGAKLPETATELVAIQPLGSKPPLCLVHGVGGGMFWGYANLARHLGPDQPVYAFKPREEPRPAEESLEAMAARYVADLRRLQPTGPYYLGGYCFGGTVAYEMSRQLAAAGEEVALLALINSAPPNSSYTHVRYTPLWALKFLKNLVFWAGNSLHWTPEQRRGFILWKLGVWKKRLKRWTAFSGMMAAVEPLDELIDFSRLTSDERRLWEAHVRALLAYHPQPFTGRATLFRSSVHHLVCSYDARHGWGEFVLGGVEVRVIPGAHETIIEEPRVAMLARELGASLRQAQIRRTAALSAVEERAAPKPKATERNTDTAPHGLDDPGSGSRARWFGEQEPAVLSVAPNTPLLPARSARGCWGDVMMSQEGPAVLDFPVDLSRHSRASATTDSGAITDTVRLAPADENALRNWCAQANVELPLVLLAAVGALLHRYARQTCFTLSSGWPGRGCNLPGRRILVPFNFEGNPAFPDLLDRVRIALKAALEHQSPKLGEPLELPRHLPDRITLRAAFDLRESVSGDEDRDPASDASSTLAEIFDARFACSYVPGQCEVRLICAAKWFTPAFVRQMRRRLEVLLTGLAAAPEHRISELPWLTSEERHRLLVEWNATRMDYPLHRTYPELFATQASAHPARVAVRYLGRDLTYAELDARAEALARHLREYGVGPERIVALALDRSPEFMVAVLAVFKAGGAYLPLDLLQPRERLEQLLAETAPVVLLTKPQWQNRLPAGVVPILRLDGATVVTDGARGVEMPAQKHPAKLTPDHLAYVMYTSGSTGQPKGVQITQRSLVNHNCAVADRFQLSPEDRVLQFAALTFDLSVEEIFPAWLRGATVILRPDSVLGSAARFFAFVEQEQITVLDLPTAYWHELVDAWRGRQVPDCVRLVVIGGEAASADRLAVWQREIHTRARLLNTYGPTEATVSATCYAFPIGNDDSRMLIGKPLSNTQVYLLDAYLQPVPVGVPGELYIGGAGVARGYLGRPELTASRFIPDLFAEEPGARLYRTGDLARYHPDGELEFLGRLDDQVKIRGYRVELGEIEAALRRHPDIKDAVVAACADTRGEQRLAVYYTGRRASVPAPDLAAFLKAKLPPHMIPDAFIQLEALPLTAHNKVNRRGLPPPDFSRAGGGEAGGDPRTPVEAEIARVWCEVLGLNRVGIHENFFQLGGHSLHAIQVMARLEARLGIQAPLVSLFDLPTIAALAGGLSGALAAPERQGGDTIPRAPRGQPLPLSPGQQRLWFMHQLQGGAALFNLPQCFRLTGPLNTAALEESLNEIVRRHEALRTNIVVLADEPVQVVAPFTPQLLRQLDLQAVPAPEREAELERRLVIEARQPFDLGRDVLLRPVLARCAENDHVLLLVMHHIAADGWSTSVLLKELVALYEAFSAGRPSPLAEPALQYTDFALWEQRRLNGERLDALLGYWTRRLAGMPARLDWPSDHPRPVHASGRGARHPVRLERETVERLRTLTQAENGTLFMGLLAAFQALASRYTGREDIVMGSPLAVRTRPELESLIGFFTNVVVLRTDLSGNPTFRELLRRTREGILGDYAHQDLPFERLVETLQPARDAGVHPLFQTMLVLQNLSLPRLQTLGLQFRPFDLNLGHAQFDLTLELTETPNGLEGWFEYALDLFTPTTIARLADHFQTLLTAATAQPELKLGELPLLGYPERQRMIEGWNRTELEVPVHETLVSLFEAQARQTPAAEALVAGDRRFTYAALNEQASRLAQMLRSAGVGPEVLVGVCLNRSPELVVAILAVLKAGGAYVPLDPNYPRERIDFILRDARAPVLLTQQSLLARLETSGRQVICLDALQETSSVVASSLPTGPENLAYVIYTSGSTGQPKGVAIEHRNAVNLVYWAQQAYPPEERAGVLAATSVCFDLSVFELFVPLCSGGKVILAENALALPELPAASEVTLVNTVPSAAAELARIGGFPATVRVVNLAGEPLAPQLVDQIYRVQPSIRKIYDLYGPTEDTVYTTGAVRRPGEPATIGRPLANKQIYLLDRFGQPVPAGVPGELFIGGAGLARGYLHRPELTEERFVPDPFSGRPGARLYRTGDLARFRADGNLEFLGRLDHQVKIRGFRIELGEIESRLRDHSAVREAVVVAWGETGDQRLAAYIVSRQTSAPSAYELCGWLEQKLPEYMIPGHFITLESLPLTPSGKVDRKALPAPDRSRAESDAPYEAPRTEIEHLLARIWIEVLKIDRVGIHDHFFRLGGHSLMITQVLSRLRDAIQVDLPMRTMFEAPTIARLAEVVEAKLLEEISALSEEEAKKLYEAAEH